uniref:Uncharacterized protein n=1 Tax=Arundo donax TaxID=35708 RepID=A0A0A9G7W7_ARUDO
MMLSTSASTLKSLRFLFLDDLACCTQLPDGLCQIPNLEFIQIRHAPAIKYIGPNFVHAQHYHHRLHRPSERLQTFPRLCKLKFLSMVEWEEWEWEGQADVQAMPFLEVLSINCCKLRCVPPGLTFHATSLRELTVIHTQCLESLGNFASVIRLNVEYSPNLVRIAEFPKLQKLSIISCSKLKLLDGVHS